MQAAADHRARSDSFTLYDIDNNRFEAESIIKLAEVMGVTYSRALCANRGEKSRIGLSLTPHDLIELRDPEGEAFVLTRPRVKEFLATFDELTTFCIEQLLEKQRPSKGWAAKILTN